MITPTQEQQVDRLAASLDREQAIWLSGYFAGLGRPARRALTASQNGAGPALAEQAAQAAAPATRLVTVLYGTETGNGKELARSLVESAQAAGVEARLVDMADYRTRALKDEQDLLVITSTHGEGDPPQTALGLFEFLESRKAPELRQMRFAVLGLGDSTYEHYCGAARRIDERLAELGAQRLIERVDCDVDYEDGAAAWIEAVLAELTLGERHPVPGAPSPARDGGAPASAFGKKHPFHAAVFENIVLTGRGSTKQTRHIELSLEGSGLTYQPGTRSGSCRATIRHWLRRCWSGSDCRAMRR